MMTSQPFKSNELPQHVVVYPGKELKGATGLEDCPDIPGDKSLSHRAILFSALATGESRIRNLLVSGVTQAMLQALQTLNIPWQIEDNLCKVYGVGLNFPESGKKPEEVRIDCGNSATTLRLLAGALSAWSIKGELDGSAGLRSRPMGRIVNPLQRMGVNVAASEGCAPLIFGPSKLPLRALEICLPVASAQVKSCLMLAALAADGCSSISEPGISRDHSERMLKSMGARVESFPYYSQEVVKGCGCLIKIWPVSAAGGLAPLDIHLPGDFSAAAFIIVAALITPGSNVTLRGVGLNPTRTGLLDALARMGAQITVRNLHEQSGEPVGDIEASYSRLTGVEVSGDLVVRMIDEFPVFAVAAAYARGTTRVRDAVELRYKETDRIDALCSELRNLGIEAEELPDGFEIRGGRPVLGGEVASHGDHRLAMSLMVAGLAAQDQVVVAQAQMMNESFPQFIEILTSLGAHIKRVEDR